MDAVPVNLFDFKAYGPLYGLIGVLLLGGFFLIRHILNASKESQDKHAALQAEILAKNDERERRYIGVIETQTQTIRGFEQISQRIEATSEDVKEIKKILVTASARGVN